jgi:hypothetical protein
MVDLGFKREESDDSIFFDKYGYEWFWLRLSVSKRLYFEWDCNTHTVELWRINKGSDVLGKLSIGTKNQLLELIEFYKKETKK